jgi:hypothetical protein
MVVRNLVRIYRQHIRSIYAYQEMWGNILSVYPDTNSVRQLLIGTEEIHLIIKIAEF